jgi:hypothetical protein
MQMLKKVLLKQVLPNLQQDLAPHWTPLLLHLLLGLAHPPLQQGLPPPRLLLGLAPSMILAVMGPTAVPLLFTTSTQVCALHLASAFLI